MGEIKLYDSAPKGWMCPQCGKAHSPDVQTCPEGEKQVQTYEPYLPSIPPEYWSKPMPMCGCKPGTVCGNAACPHRMVITC